MLGKRVGSYRIIEKLAQGGMGEVYLATHHLIDREVVVKVLQRQYTHNAGLVHRFFNEARAASSIEHPGVVKIYELGEEDGQVYIVMERLRGQTLTSRLAERESSIEETLVLSTQLASAVGAAHAARIVHRDLKPDNLFLVRDPDMPGGERIKILDFGIAKLAPDAGGEHPTAKGSFFGTPAYMAPEQCKDAGQVDHRADLYAIGCIMYEMLCGMPPFGRGGIELLAAHLRDQPARPSERVPDIPDYVEAAVLRLLAKEPEQRLQSCDELLAALHTRKAVPPPRSSTMEVASAPTLQADTRTDATFPPARAPARPSLMRILIVDDNATNRRVTQHMVKHLGGLSETASSGAEALAMLRDGFYDLVLMDCQMPGLDGYETTRQIRALDGVSRDVPIVAITAHRLLESRDKCLAAGMDDYLTKPIRLDVLRRTVERWSKGREPEATARPTPTPRPDRPPE